MNLRRLACLTLASTAVSVLSCSDNGSWVYHQDGNYGPKWWDDKTHAKYLHPSDSAPESLKSYYDPELTRALNAR